MKLSRQIYKSTRVKGLKPEIFCKALLKPIKKHLTMSGCTEAGSEGQSLAIVLLENAYLPSSTFYNLVSHLSSKANSTADKSVPKAVNISIKRLNALKTATENVEKV